ncbi:hypothetical protein Lal_00010925 [Lupinus albus]|nr:hypothetical protein Lal_00010925 [Lupinus albus]
MEWALCQDNPMMPCSEVVHPLRLSHMVAPGFNNGQVSDHGVMTWGKAYQGTLATIQRGEDILLDRTVLTAQTRQSLTTPRFAIVIDERDVQKALLRHRPIMDSSFGTDRSFILARMLFYFGAYNQLGPCVLELELVCRGTSMWLPQHHAYLEASFTLPPREPPVAPEAHDTTFRRTAEAGPSTRKRTWQDCLDAPAYRRAVRRSMPLGTTGRRTLPDPPSSSLEPMEDESTEIEAEEDPSECSSTPSSAVSSR